MTDHLNLEEHDHNYLTLNIALRYARTNRR